MPRVVAYIRVSTDKRNVENLRSALQNFCEERNYKVDEWIEEQMELPLPLIQWLEPGDTLICNSLLDHSNVLIWAGELTEQLNRGIVLVSVAENFVLRNDSTSKMLLGIGAMTRAVAPQVERAVCCPECGAPIPTV